MARTARLVLITAMLMFGGGVLAQNLLNHPESVVYDVVHNRYLVTNYGNGAIIQIDSLGQQSTFASGMGRCMSICILGDTVFTSTPTDILAFNLHTAQKIILYFPDLPYPRGNYDGLTTDTSGNVYMVDTGGRIIKIRLSDGNCSMFVTVGLSEYTQDIVFDSTNNRLLVVGYATNAPIQAVQFPDSMVTNVVAATPGSLDGITMDRFGNVYISNSSGGKVHRYAKGLQQPPELISAGHQEPAGLEFNNHDNVLAIPNFAANRVDIVPVDFDPIIDQWEFRDLAGGDGDGLFEAGESIDLVVSVANIGLSSITNVTATLMIDDAALSPINTVANIGDIASHDTVDNASQPFTFSIPGDFVSRFDSFFVALSYDKGGPKVDTFVATTAIGAPRILLVDDDNGDDLEAYYGQPLMNLGIPYGVRDASAPFTATDLSGYDLVIWFTGDVRADLLSSDDISTIEDFLDGGGNLFLTGQAIARQLDAGGRQDFLNNYLRCDYLSSLWSPAALSGTIGSQIWTTDDSLMITGPGGASNQTAPDQIATINGGVGELAYVGLTDFGAVSYAGTGRLLFFSFGFEAIAGGGAVWQNRDTALSHILAFFQFQYPATMVLGVTGGDGQHMTNHTPEFFWAYSRPDFVPQQLHIQVGSDNDWTTAEMWDYGPVSSTATSMVYGGSELLDGQSYYYRVRLSDGSAWSLWYGGQIRMNSAPTAPDGLVPDDFQEFAEARPILSHSNAVDADSDDRQYAYEVYGDSLLTVLVAQAQDYPENPLGTTSWQVPEPLPLGADYYWRVRAHDGYEYGSWSDLAFFVIKPAFLCGDANGDGQINVGDAVHIINYVFKGGQEPNPMDAGDANCDGTINVGDAVHIINYVFKGGDAPCCP